MMCLRPFRTGVGEFGCGQCMCCRVNKRREWSSRILLESKMHTHSTFATLTIADVPKGHHGPPQRRVWELMPEDFTLFMKRLRANYSEPLRYFAVGEYGERGMRPHFHAALFGVSVMERELVEKIWGLGGVHLGELNKDSAQYLAGYVTKKMTKADDPRLHGRKPEFARMSRRPGIGVPAVSVLADSLTKAGGLSIVEKAGDIPNAVRVRGKLLPIGRTLRGKFREAMGMEPEEPQARKRQRAAAYAAENPSVRETRRDKHMKQTLFRNSLTRSKRTL